MRKPLISNRNENFTKNHGHCLIAFTSKKWLVKANVSGEKERPQGIGSTGFRESLRSHASVPRVENFIVWGISRPRLIRFREGNSATCQQNSKYELHGRKGLLLLIRMPLRGEDGERLDGFYIPQLRPTRKPNRSRTMDRTLRECRPVR